MNITAKELLGTKQFREYLGSLQDPNLFLQKVNSEVNTYKIDMLNNIFPKDFSLDQRVASLLLNLQQDYDTMIKNLPGEFQMKESGLIHVGNTNQIGVYYNGRIQRGKERFGSRIACVSLHFRDISGAQIMHIESIQGELIERRYSRREVRRVFGKLNSYFREDWKVGLLRQLCGYAHDRRMGVKGEVPGIFCFFGSSFREYPMYSLNYVQTYLRAGVSLENIEFRPVPDDVKTRWDMAINFLKNRNPEERLSLITSAAKAYTNSYTQLRSKWLEEEAKSQGFSVSNEMEFARVFTKYFS